MLQTLFAYFIPPALQDEQEAVTRRRARLAVLIPLVGTGPLYALPFYFVGFDEGAWVCLVLGSVIWTAPWLLRWTGSLPLVGHLITALTLLHVVLLMAVTGGVSSVMVPWLVNAVLVALLLMGRRPALGWLGAAVIIIGATYGLTHAGFSFPNRTPAAIETAFVTVLQLNNTLVVFGLAFLLDQENERVVNTLAEARHEAERAATRVEEQAEHLARLDAAKSEFFANVSHEFRTPLTIALGLLAPWVEGPDGAEEERQKELSHADPSALPDDARRDLRQVLLNNRRLLRLVNQLLDLAELESGTLALDRQRIDLRAALNGAADAFVGLAERRGVSFRRVLPDRPMRAPADPNHLETIVTNLLSNAFKYTPEQGTVTIQLTATDEAARIQVVDTGPGIPADEQEAIFERFRQGEGTTEAGTGIGLALTKALAERHGGTVSVTSTVGEGTTFTVTLPRAMEGAAEAALSETSIDASLVPGSGPDALGGDGTGGGNVRALDERGPTASPDRPTVLVVDDNSDIRAYVRRMLSDDYRVVEAADGAEGLEGAREHMPDCIVADVMMPDTDGVAMLRALREDPATDFIPVVLLTARAAPDDKLAGLDAGADDYLTKPFRPAELTTRIRNLIAQRMRLRERFQADGIGDEGATTGPANNEPTSPFLQTVKEAIRTRLGDEELTVSTLATEVGASRSKLYRKLDDATDASPAELIWQVRLDEARRLLEEEAGNVSEVAYGVGFKSVSHFTNRFRERFEKPPSAVAASETR